MSTSPKRHISGSLVNSSVVGSNMHFGGGGVVSGDAQPTSVKKTKLPSGTVVTNSVVDGTYFTDAISIGGYLVEMGGPAAPIAPVKPTPPVAPAPLTEPSPAAPEPAQPDDDENRSFLGDVFRRDGGLNLASIINAAQATAGAPKTSVEASGMHFPTSSLASCVPRATMGLPDGARVQTSTLGQKFIKDAIIVKGALVEICELPDGDELKEAGVARVFVRDSVIDAGNLILGEWPAGRIIADTNVVGTDNRIFESMETCTVFGDSNVFRRSASDLRVFGSENEFYVEVQRSQVTGSRNCVNTDVKRSTITGKKNVFKKGVQSSVVRGNKNTFGGQVISCNIEGDKNEFGGDIVGSSMQASNCGFGQR